MLGAAMSATLRRDNGKARLDVRNDVDDQGRE